MTKRVKIISNFSKVPPYWRYENLATLKILSKNNFPFHSSEYIDFPDDIFAQSEIRSNDSINDDAVFQGEFAIENINGNYSYNEISHDTGGKVVTPIETCFFELEQLVYSYDLQNFYINNDYWFYVFVSSTNNYSEDGSLILAPHELLDLGYSPDLDELVCTKIWCLMVEEIEPFFDFHFLNYSGSIFDFLIHSTFLDIWRFKDNTSEMFLKRHAFYNWIFKICEKYQITKTTLIEHLKSNFIEIDKDNYLDFYTREIAINNIFNPKELQDNTGKMICVLKKTTDVAVYCYFKGELGLGDKISLDSTNLSLRVYEKEIKILNEKYYGGSTYFNIDSVKKDTVHIATAIKDSFAKNDDYDEKAKSIIQRVEQQLTKDFPDEEMKIQACFKTLGVDK